MSTIRVEKHGNYSIIANHCFGDGRLSYRAVGLLCHLLSKPNDWKVQVPDLVKAHREGRDAVYAAITELEECGYVTREKGFGSVDYVVREYPEDADSQDTAFQDADNQVTGKPHLLITELDQRLSGPKTQSFSRTRASEDSQAEGKHERTGSRTQPTVAGKTTTAAPARHEAGGVATMERATPDQDTPLPPSRATQTIPEWFTTWHALYASANPERVVPVGEAYWMLHGIATKLAIKPTPSELLAKLKAHVDSEDWFKEGGKYVPSMRKYIHERWWERQAGPVSSKRWTRNGFVYPIYVQGKGLTWPPGHRVGQYDTQMPQVLDERGNFIPNPMLY